MSFSSVSLLPEPRMRDMTSERLALVQISVMARFRNSVRRHPQPSRPVIR